MSLQQEASGGVTGGDDRRRDECCLTRVASAGVTGDGESGHCRRSECRCYQRGAQELPEGASTGVAGGSDMRRDRGESGAVTGEARVGVTGGVISGATAGSDWCGDRKRRVLE